VVDKTFSMTPAEEAKAKKHLLTVAVMKVKKDAKTILFLKRFEKEISTLRDLHYSWDAISGHLQTATGQRVSPDTVRNWFNAKGRTDTMPNQFKPAETLSPVEVNMKVAQAIVDGVKLEKPAPVEEAAPPAEVKPVMMAPRHNGLRVQHQAPAQTAQMGGQS